MKKRTILWWPLVAALVCVLFGVGALIAHIRPTVAGAIMPLTEQQSLVGGIGMLVLAGIFTVSAFLFRKDEGP